MELRQRRGAAADPELVEDVLEVLADGGRLDPQLPRDLGVGEAILHASHHVAFAGGQRRDAGRPLAEEQRGTILGSLDEDRWIAGREEETFVGILPPLGDTVRKALAFRSSSRPLNRRCVRSQQADMLPPP